MATKKVHYSEPVDYFPKSVRKELKIGEYAPKKKAATTTTKKTATRAKKKK